MSKWCGVYSSPYSLSLKKKSTSTSFLLQETGGTIVSSALKLMKEIVADRYPANEWNIYAAQAFDGDNWAMTCLAVKSYWWIRFCRLANTTRTSRSRVAHTKTLWHEYEKLEASLTTSPWKYQNKHYILPPCWELFQKETARKGLAMTAKSVKRCRREKSRTKNNDKMLPDGPDWTFNLLERYHVEIKRVAQHYRLNSLYS